MKALLLNGSPRKGNTYTALEALKRGLANINELEICEINATNMAVSSCIACECCRNGDNVLKCVFDDDTNAVMEAVLDADLLVFAMPVYWWGIPAQLKLIVDKFYSRTSQLSACNKQIGVIVVGQLSQDDPQYEIIPKQFQCISNYLGWRFTFCKTYTADKPEDLSKDMNAIAELENLWKQIQPQ